MPGKYNPFRPDKIVHPTMFAGRGAELLTIHQCLLQTRAGNPRHFVITGERGIGKSSLCLIADHVARGSLQTYYERQTLNQMVVSVALSDKDDYYSIIKAIASGLQQQVRRTNVLKSFVLGAWDFISNFEAGGIKFRKDAGRPADSAELLSKLVQDIEHIVLQMAQDLDGILILIDEADRPSAEADLGLLCKSLTEQLQREGCEKVCIGISGLPSVMHKLRESHESAPRIFHALSLQPLEPDERVDVIRRGLADAEKHLDREIGITDEAVKFISDLSEGYPHFIQQFCYCAYEEDRDDNVDLNDVTISLRAENGAFDQLGAKYFEEFYHAPSSDDYRKILDFMAGHSVEWIDRATIVKNSGLKPGTVDNGLRALKGRNIILQNELRRGEYRLPTLSFATWIRAKAEASKR